MNQFPREVRVFCEGGPGIGGGHLSRCAALGAAWVRMGGSCTFRVNRDAPPGFHPQGCGVERVEDPLDLSCWPPFPLGVLGVVDSYRIDPRWLDQAAKRLPLVAVDDGRSFPLEEQVGGVLNYNLHAPNLGYGGEGLLLLGPRFALLRPAFWDLEPRQGEGVLLVAGASDPSGVTGTVLSWWRRDWPRLEAVSGPLVSPQERARCHALARDRGNAEVRDAPPDLPERMARAGRVLCTSSVTCYEALGLRKPLGVFQVADNQVPIGAAVAAQGLGTNLGPWGTWGPEELDRWLRSAPSSPPGVVNPRGALEAAEALRRFAETRGGLS